MINRRGFVSLVMSLPAVKLLTAPKKPSWTIKEGFTSDMLENDQLPLGTIVISIKSVPTTYGTWAQMNGRSNVNPGSGIAMGTTKEGIYFERVT